MLMQLAMQKIAWGWIAWKRKTGLYGELAHDTSATMLGDHFCGEVFLGRFRWRRSRWNWWMR